MRISPLIRTPCFVTLTPSTKPLLDPDLINTCVQFGQLDNLHNTCTYTRIMILD